MRENDPFGVLESFDRFLPEEDCRIHYGGKHIIEHTFDNCKGEDEEDAED